MIAIFAMTICGFAQMDVCSDACAPHANAADYSTGVIPTYPTEFPVLNVGEAVDQCVSVKIPSSIAGSDIPNIGTIASGRTISINNVTLNELVNLPTGLTACASANPMAAEGTYTMRITGTPIQAGTFELKLKVEIDGEVSGGFIPVSIGTVNTAINGLGGVSTGITITVEGESIPAPVADFTTDPEASDLGGFVSYISINQGQSVTFTNASSNAHHIAWTFEGGTPATSTENTVTVVYNETPTVYFTATLTAYNENETVSDSKSVYVRVTSLNAVEETSIDEINVYPNPTSSVINIAAEGMQNITIMDMTGRVVMSKDVNSNFETINAEGFAKANYMVRIATADGVVVKNIVVE
ncbi:MAG: T9SS type A sorting domain-containing protein [Bacteroidales bacterium]|nr:T9SS type A sorting domain-containing protein [Bacteroidales bacterium]